MGQPRKTTAQFVEDARRVHGDKYDYTSTQYVDSKTKVLIVCPEHGPFWQRPNDHLAKKAGCRQCVAHPLRCTTEQFIAKAREVHAGKYDYSAADYRGSEAKLTIICPDHGAFHQTPIDHLSGHGCAKCAVHQQVKARTWTTAQFIAAAQSRFGERYDYSKAAYITSLTPIEIICPTHGAYWTKPHYHLTSTGCPKCSKVARSTHAEFIARAKAIHGDRYDYTKTQFARMHLPITVTCREHGDFEQIAKTHVTGHHCPACANAATASQGEHALADWLASLGVRIVRNDRSTLAGFELDIWLPEHGIGIEYHGAYWHHDERLYHPRVHEIKAARAEQLGLRLIAVWDFEWATQQATVQSLLKHAMGLSDATRHNARDCLVQTVTARQASEFYATTHIQGPPNAARLHYGLRQNGALLACMSFSQGASRRGKTGDNEWELLRFSTRGIVRGAASRLFRAFVREHAPQAVWSFSDRQRFSGTLYKTLGFYEDGRLAADYRVYHQRTQKLWHKSAWQRRHIPARLAELGITDAFDPATDPRTEREMQRLAGVLRIMDAGKIRWKWENRRQALHPAAAIA